ncbi:MAG TPA: hypothetical protein VEV17_22350 [Bryobacteraceae bacterium]|nr:hypothetical protein [Bryobacteraceae bacterium]
MRTFVIWEPVLPTDQLSPSTASLRRISDTRAEQFWDRRRLISHSMGEHDRDSIVWDYIAVYPPGEAWNDHPPLPLFHGGPVAGAIGGARAALVQAVQRVSP